MTTLEVAFIEIPLIACMVILIVFQAMILLLATVPALLMSWIFIRSGGVVGFAFVAMLWWLALRAAYGT